MTVTEQTNIDLPGIARVLRDADDICICGHMNPDGDCMGSALALRLCLLQLGKNVCVLRPSPDELDPSFRFLPGADELVFAGKFKGTCATFIAVDAPNPERMGHTAAALQRKAPLTITIDHHAAPERMSTYSYTDPDAASTTMIIWELAKAMGVQLTAGIATCAYAGLITDTGRFQHQNTDAAALASACEMVAAGANASKIAEQFFQRRSLASVLLEGRTIDHMRLLCEGRIAISYVTREDMVELSARKADCEPLVETLRCIDGVKVCCMLRQEKETVRGSFRAKDATDVAEIARGFGGGGHKAAAGFTLHESLERSLEIVEAALLRAVCPESEEGAGEIIAGTDAGCGVTGETMPVGTISKGGRP